MLPDPIKPAAATAENVRGRREETVNVVVAAARVAAAFALDDDA